MATEITKENSLPRKSERYYLGEAVIRSQFNDVEFYFEDKDQQEMYFSIMQKLFGDKIRFEKVFITSGKNGAYELLDKNRNSKKKIFILDKDFDDLLRIKKRAGNLFYLNRYSIENFLLEEEALRWLIISRNPSLNRNSLVLPYDTLMKEVMEELQPLIAYFFVAKKHKISDYISGFKTCSQSVIKFLETGEAQVCTTKTNAYWQTVVDAISTHLPSENPTDLLESAKRSIGYGNLEIDGVFKHIPGKHFLELLRNKITKLFPFMRKEQTSQIMFTLADKCRFDSLSTLKEEINTYLAAA